jgi:hypothetical protein
LVCVSALVFAGWGAAAVLDIPVALEDSTVLDIPVALEDSTVLDVPLVLEERAGVARQAEPILCGVPLPKGLCHDPDGLCLVDEKGGTVPAVFTAANRWWDDGSVKWVHVDLQRSLVAGGRETLRLRLAKAQPAAPGGLEVQETDSSISVTTGPLRFRVRKRGFNLLDQVWLDESGRGRFDGDHAVLADRPRGFRVRDGHRTAWASADPDCRVEVEERNALRVVIRAEGRHRAEDGSPLTDFITRIIAYRGKPYVRVSHAFLWPITCRFRTSRWCCH